MSEDYVRYKIESSDEAHEDALVLIAAARWNAAISRLYYAAFHLVSALLLAYGHRAKTHSGIKHLFLEHFVREGTLSQEEASIYVRLYNWRNDADYGDFLNFNEQATRQALEDVMKLTQHLKALIQEKGY